ncbi:lytic transglycosylase domain-containing protein [Saccharomonospora viridis]|uniref:Murein transglycosylase n=1 Tax=Saccharomonospora viridis TaxID=1852 RepID=A0A837DA25_9PSEU|nr:lytic murein transglycosylase [Saccharomonospora viridis]KHF43708.1 murein transglycosylase [Saccharomonospora viridis]SFP85564.1 Transglycosylase SLT domain-containing protein [Saccharomonospora viridis]
MADSDSPSSLWSGVARWGRAVLIRLSVVVVVFLVGAGGVWLIARAAIPFASPTTTDIPALRIEPADVEPGSTAPVKDNDIGPLREDAADTGVSTLTEWAEHLAPAVGIPARAMTAYGNAELVMRDEAPECRLSWVTIAGIGRIESDHGRHGGAVLGDDGRPSPPIIGIPLDGSPGVREIRDTDGGVLDGDRKYDRAVGPMQFIPTTWKLYGVDASGDGKADPQQIDDAALATARYLCDHGRDMATGQGWWDGVLSYNHSVEYGRKVFALAEHYAELAQSFTG